MSSPLPPEKGLSVETVQVRPSALLAIHCVPFELLPTAIQYEPFHAIPYPIPPSKGLLVETVQVIPSLLLAIQFVYPELEPTAIQYDPFQAMPLP